MLYAIFAVLAIILDQWVKYWTESNLAVGESRALIPGVVELFNVHNDGAAFSILKDANAGKLFAILAVIFAALVVVGLITNFISGKLARWSAVFVAAGGIGNALDRVLNPYVQDMFHFTFLEDFPVFNVADIFITVFCLIFIICIIFGGKGSSDSEEDIDYYEEEFEDVPKVRSGRSSRRIEDDYDDDYDRRSRNRRQADTFEEDERPSRRRVQSDDYDDEPSPRQRRAIKGRDTAESGDDAYPSRFDSESNRTVSRRSRNAEFEEAFAPRQSSKPAPRKAVDAPEQPAPRRKPVADDPFSEWDRLNASSGYGREASDAAYSNDSAPRRSRQESAYSEDRAPAAPVAPKPVPAAPKPAPVQPSRPAAPKKSSSDDFSLDDILAEFK